MQSESTIRRRRVLPDPNTVMRARTVANAPDINDPRAPGQPWDNAPILPDGRPLSDTIYPGAPVLRGTTPSTPDTAGPLRDTLERMRAPEPNAAPVWMGERTGTVDDSGNVRPGMNRLGILLAERRGLQHADPRQDVSVRPEGIWEGPPPNAGGHSRRNAVLMGLLHGIAMTDPRLGLAGQIGGAGAGAAAGAKNPRLVEAFTRRGELARNAGEVANEQELEMGTAKLAQTAAQTENLSQQPELQWYRLDEAHRRQAALEADRAADNARADRAAHRAEGDSAERARHNKEMEARPTGGPTEEITINGRKMRVSANTAARILEDRTKAGNKPDPAREAGYEADAEHEAGEDHLNKRKAADTQAATLRTDREKVAGSTSTSLLHRKEFEAEKAKKLADYDRQIREAEAESTYRQREADDAFQRERKARAKAGSPTGTASNATPRGKVFNLGKWKTDHPGADPTSIRQRAIDAGMTVKE